MKQAVHNGRAPVVGLPANGSATAIPARDPAALVLARALYAERRRRDRHFPGEIFGEPSWDILLDLYIAAREKRRVPTTSACIGAHVPPTTALRWLRVLEDKGLVEREEDQRDGRRTFVRLSRSGLNMVETFLNASRMCEAISGGPVVAFGETRTA